MFFDLDMLLRLSTFLMSGGAMVAAWIASRRKDVEERFKVGSDRMDGHERRISGLEQVVQSLPNKDELHDLKIELVRLSGHLSKLEAVIDGNAAIMKRLESIVTRQEDHLLGSTK